jgi:tetratricopeptide (TPR) repeat protein/predicted Ser/Thr protein kinase
VSTPEHYLQVSEILKAAMDRPAAERAAFLDEACAGNVALRAEVEALLAHDQNDSGALADDGLGIGLELMRAARTALGAETLPHEPSTRELPTQVGGYHVERLIAEGGMGSVLLARQESPRRTVALKLMRPGRDSRALLRRFRQEAHVLGQLQHPGIAHVYEAGLADVRTPDGNVTEQPFIAMEYVDGSELHQHVQRHQLDPRQRMKLMASICDAVQCAHDKGVIHRDLKPSNILVDQSGRPKILDFGVARAMDREILVTTMETDAGQLIGTLAYMSPEQVRADPAQIDARSDVYALGVLLYELLADKPPYTLRDVPVPEAMRIICDEESTSLSSIDSRFRGDVETLVAKALEKDPARRYASARDFGADIERYLANKPLVARPPSAMYQLRKFARRNQGLVAGVIGMIVILIAGMATTSWFAWQATRQRDAAGRERDAARREARRVAALNTFLVDDLFGAVDPRSGAAYDRSVLDMLNDATANLEVFVEDPDIEILIRTALGKIFRELGNLDAAERHLRRALSLSRELYGDEHADTLTPRRELALTLLVKNQFDESQRLLTTQLAIQQAQEVVDQTEVARTLGSLGNVAYRWGHYDKAEQLYRRVIDVLEAAGQDHLQLYTDTLNGLANVMHNAGRLEESVALHREVLARRIEELGADHIRVSESQHNLGAILIMLGELEEANRLLLSALAIRHRLLGDAHRHVADTLQQLGRVRLEQGDARGAREYAAQALAMQRQLLPEQHGEIAFTLDLMAKAAAAEGDLETHERCFREAYAIYAVVEGPNSRAAAASLANIGTSLRLQERFDEAVEAHVQGLQAIRAAFPPDSPSVYRYQTSLGICLTRTGRYADAEVQLLEAYANLNRLHNPAATQTYDALKDLYEAWDRPELLDNVTEARGIGG